MLNFLPWLFWRRAAQKEQEKLDKVVEDLGKSDVIAELAERDPEFKKNLRTLGVKIGNDDQS